MKRRITVATVVGLLMGAMVAPGGAQGQPPPPQCDPPSPVDEVGLVECVALAAGCPSTSKSAPPGPARTTTCAAGPASCVVERSFGQLWRHSYRCQIDGGSAGAGCGYREEAGGSLHTSASEERGCDVAAGDTTVRIACERATSAGGGMTSATAGCIAGPVGLECEDFAPGASRTSVCRLAVGEPSPAVVCTVDLSAPEASRCEAP